MLAKKPGLKIGWQLIKPPQQRSAACSGKSSFDISAWAGEAAGAEKSSDLCIAEGALAGYAAALDSGCARDNEHLKELTGEVEKYADQRWAEPVLIDSPKDQGYVCVCQDVKAREVLGENEKLKQEMLHEFATELIKRRTGILTGPCQGKFCLCNFIRILAKSDAKDPSHYPIPTVRPPVTPLTINDMTRCNNNDRKDV